MQPISTPFFQYFDLDGSPLENGSLYFGVANQNPETNPVALFWDQYLTQPAAQPIKTINGFIVRDGIIAQVYTPTNYSFTVRNKKGSIVVSSANSAESAFGVMFATLDAATAALANIGTSVQSQLWAAFTTTGSSGAYILNPLPALTGYVSDRWKLNVKFHTAGNGTDTIDVNGLGLKNIKQYNSQGAKVAPVIKGGMITDLLYDGTDWIILNPLPSDTPVGSFLLGASAIAPAGYLLCQSTVVNVSRTTYAALFAVIGTTWGAGDGSSTFGIPSFKSAHAMLQADGGLGYGVETTGDVKSHTHLSNAIGLGGGTINWVGTGGVPYNTINNTYVSYSGGSHNLPAGKGVAIYIKY